ncbi:outer membrane beta-barrel protein [Aquibium microcysteis]|uniref:outer membrane beta-barrel protein n=1 Tax=Aquibium microcysteis TaxID=675281 RepID=UPI00165D1339|nr:outer membrane beta-barrel protein [Aquibium microcysteis]
MKLLSRLLLSGAALSVLPSAPSAAADYDAPLYVEEAPEYVPVEIGSGWYLRGDVGYDFKRDYSNIAFSIADPLDITQETGFDETKTVVSGTVGFGYHVNDIFRVDLTAGFLGASKASSFGIREDACAVEQTVSVVTFDQLGDPIDPPTVTTTDANADCYSESSAEASAWTGMANVYADLGTVAGFTPYVGAGIGLVYTPVRGSFNDRTCSASETVQTVAGVSETTTTQLCEGQTSATDADVEYPGTSIDRNKVSLLYSLGAGVSYQLSQNASLDVGYNWITAPGAESVAIRNDDVVVVKGMNIHQVKVGLRYDLW